MGIPLGVESGGMLYVNPKKEFVVRKGDKVFLLAEKYPRELEQA